MHAARNIGLCNKDCVCLFVCPTGATDTETGQIDFSKCLDGCRLCVDACPSHAIYLTPANYATPQIKSEEVILQLNKLAESKIQQERIAAGVARFTEDTIVRQLAKALEKSNRILAEDCYREAGYMLPQSDTVRNLLNDLLDSRQPDDFPKEAVERLLELL